MGKPTTKRTPLVLTNMKSFRDYYIKRIGRISIGEYYNYIKIIMTTVKEFIIEGGYLILPQAIGYIYIMRKTRNGIRLKRDNTIKEKYVNWRATYNYRKKQYPNYTIKDWKKPENKTKGLIFYTNEHSDGKVYSFKYDNPDKKRNGNTGYYYFKPTDKLSKQLGQYLKSTKKIPNYYERNKDYSSGFNYGTFIRQVTADNKTRAREGYREHLRRIEEDRTKTK